MAKKSKRQITAARAAREARLRHAGQTAGTGAGTEVGNGANSKKPFVSVCTPTFNRRPFIQAMISNFLSQDYPHDRMEWIIVDDGTDQIGDLVRDLPCVKYYSYETKMTLGRKRNLMHKFAKGEILVYMDDDDYYPPCRVSHAVETLEANPKALCAGSSEIYIWFEHIKKMYQFGPYRDNHATAGTFAFRREMLKNNRYEDDAALAEEKAFLAGYTVPFVQLDPMKVILVFSHEHNTFDKRKLLENPHPKFVKESPKRVMDFVHDAKVAHFYTKQIGKLLDDYEPGRPNMKPDVLEQIIKIEEARRKEAERMATEIHNQNSTKIAYTGPDGVAKELDNEQVVDILGKQHREIAQLRRQISQLEGLMLEKNVELEEVRISNRRLQQQLDSVVANNGDISKLSEISRRTVADDVIEELFGSQ